MNLPPSIIRVHIIEDGKKVIGLWIPFILVWLLMLIPFILIIPVLVLAEIVTRLCGLKLNILSLTFGVINVIIAMRGLEVKVTDKLKNNNVKVCIQ